MDDYEWYDDDEPYDLRQPYVIVERREPGVGSFLIGIALGAGHPVAFPVPGGLQRVHRIHHIPGRDQRGHPRTAVGLDPDHHLRILSVCAQVLPGQLVQPGHPGHPFRQPLPGQHPARLIHQLDVVMVG